jgi:hypothetical protein
MRSIAASAAWAVFAGSARLMLKLPGVPLSVLNVRRALLFVSAIFFHLLSGFSLLQLLLLHGQGFCDAKQRAAYGAGAQDVERIPELMCAFAVKHAVYPAYGYGNGGIRCRAGQHTKTCAYGCGYYHFFHLLSVGTGAAVQALLCSQRTLCAFATL